MRGKQQTEATLVATLVSHFFQSRSLVCNPSTTTKDVLHKFNNMDLPSTCAHCMVPLVSVYFDNLYGWEVSVMLHSPPNTVYGFSDDPVHNPGIDWVHLPLDDLISHLYRLTMYILSTSIQCLLPKGHLSINNHSYRRTCIGLIQHILTRMCYLE